MRVLASVGNPPGAFSDAATRVLLAVTEGERTVRGVAARAGLSYGYV